MKFNKRSRAALAAAICFAMLALCLFALGKSKEQEPAQQGNLIENGDFLAETDGMPDGWTAGMWVTSPGASYLEVVTLEDGTRAALVENAALNDARFEQTVSVRENSTYRLTARIRAEGCDTTRTGANLSFLGIYGTSRCVYDTDGEFEIISLYARTGRGQTEATVCLRLGGYGSENTGRAWFTDVELVEVDDVPVGENALNLTTPKPQKETSSQGAKGWAIPGSALAAAVYLAFALLAVRAMRSDREDMAAGERPMLLAVLLAGAGLRLGLAALVPGYGVDMSCFAAWANRMTVSGPMGFYEEGYFCDYPPGYMLVLWLLGGIAKLTGTSLGGMDGQMLLKLVPIVCDIVLAAAVFRLVRPRMGARAALALCALVALNPAYVVTGSCWGQIDSVLALLLVLLLLAAQEGKWQIAIPVFALAVLIKPQAGLLAPLGVVALVRDVVGRGMDAAARRETRKRAALGLALGVLATLAVALPFSVRQTSPFWLIDKY
ncbi:MAG: glycosyltransferase family 39 protein, partial [Clostridia bacterium]|nr:glycosyltransferase family 39 protein [Clostridia bacterium]